MSSAARKRAVEVARCSCGCGAIILPRAQHLVGFDDRNEPVAFVDVGHFTRYLKDKRAN